MLELEVFDSIKNFSTDLLPEAVENGNLELAGTGLLAILLLVTTGFHPWLIVPNLLVHVAMYSETFKATWEHYATTYSPPAFLFVVGGLIPCTVYWLNGFLLLLMEVKWPNAELRERIESFRKQYKIQKKVLDVVLDGPKHKPGQLRVFHVVKNLVIGQVFVLIPLAWYMGILSTRDMGARDTQGKLPSTWEMIIDILGVIVVDEILFYYGHRLFHDVTFLYKKIHKIHHEFQYPCGLVAAYAHPIEMLLSNVLPLGAGLVLFRCNYFTCMVWACAAVCGTQTHHSGYRWPYTLSFDAQPNYHDFHHQEFNTNYGLLGWLDGLHGTDKKYWAYKKSLEAAKKQA